MEEEPSENEEGTQTEILGVLESENARQKASSTIRSIAFLMFVLWITLNVVNVYRSQNKLITFMRDASVKCGNNAPSGLWLALQIEYPFLSYANQISNKIPLFLYYVINTYAFTDPPQLDVSMVCGNNLSPRGVHYMIQNWKQTPFYPMIPETSKMVTDARSTTDPNISGITALFKSGFMGWANVFVSGDTRITDMWDYCFVDQNKPPKKPGPKCTPDPAGFASGIMAQGTGGAFLGAGGGPMGMIAGFLIGGAVGALLNTNKICQPLF